MPPASIPRSLRYSFRFSGQHSIHWATPARALSYSRSIPLLPSLVDWLLPISSHFLDTMITAVFPARCSGNSCPSQYIPVRIYYRTWFTAFGVTYVVIRSCLLACRFHLCLRLWLLRTGYLHGGRLLWSSRAQSCWLPSLLKTSDPEWKALESNGKVIGESSHKTSPLTSDTNSNLRGSPNYPQV